MPLVRLQKKLEKGEVCLADMPTFAVEEQLGKGWREKAGKRHANALNQ